MKTLSIIALAFLLGISAPAKKAVKETTQIVYVCTGPKASTYHRTAKCSGLNRCSREVVGIDINKAKSMGRRACKKCY